MHYVQLMIDMLNNLFNFVEAPRKSRNDLFNTLEPKLPPPRVQVRDIDQVSECKYYVRMFTYQHRHSCIIDACLRNISSNILILPGHAGILVYSICCSRPILSYR